MDIFKRLSFSPPHPSMQRKLSSNKKKKSTPTGKERKAKGQREKSP